MGGRRTLATGRNGIPACALRGKRQGLGGGGQVNRTHVGIISTGASWRIETRRANKVADRKCRPSGRNASTAVWGVAAEKGNYWRFHPTARAKVSVDSQLCTCFMICRHSSVSSGRRGGNYWRFHHTARANVSVDSNYICTCFYVSVQTLIAPLTPPPSGGRPPPKDPLRR